MAKRVTTTVDRPYKRNYLTSVIARIDFNAIPAIATDELPDEVYQALINRFPVPERRQQTVQLYTIVEKDQPPQQSTRVEFQRFFYTDNRQRSAHISSNCVYVEFKKYREFTELRRDFLGIVDALYRSYDDLAVVRFGLRYVDTFDFKGKNLFDWDDYFAPHVVAPLKLASDAKKITKVISFIETDYGSWRMRLSAGMPNPDFPSLIYKRHFVLDHDAYCQAPLKREDVHACIDQFHGTIKESFESLITDKLREKMGRAI